MVHSTQAAPVYAGTAIPEMAVAQKYIILTFLALVFYTAIVTSAYAGANTTPMGNVICYFLGALYGNLGRGIATIAVVVVGLGATLGKVSWGMAITTAVGVSVVFNASGIILTLYPGAGGNICFNMWGVT